MLAPMLMFLFGSAKADDLTPTKADDLNLYELARAMSIDLRGTVLTPEEIASIEESGTIEDSLIDSWMQSSAFEEQVIAHHKFLFWNNVSFQINDTTRILRGYSRLGYQTMYAYYRSGVLRGTYHTQCSDYPADVNALNQPQSWITRDYYGYEAETGWKDEGYVWVAPHWDMDNPIKVCAFDAQLTEISSTGTDCSTSEAKLDPECGCGENLKWCSIASEENKVETSISQALSERVRLILQNEQSYSALLTDSTSIMNGTMIEWYKNRSNFSASLSSPVPLEDLPNLDPDQEDTWISIPVEEHHPGVLTEPGWLLRHQTNRGRASRFYSAFMCREFQSPAGGIKELVEENPTPDLSRKPVCKDCHVLLEPWSAYWGRWSQAGGTYNTEDDFPTFSDECSSCAPYCGQGYCKINYLLNSTHPHQDDYIGWYKPYLYLQAENVENPTIGPRKWVEEIVADGRFAQCASQKAAIWLMGWSSDEIDYDWVQQWSADFEASGLDYRTLIRSIVTSPVYARSK